jgi:hypothetical protein
MPRSLKKPQVGTPVWYYANPAPAAPQAAVVTSTVSWSDATETGSFNLFVLSAAAVGSAVLGVAYTGAGGVAQVVTAAAVQAGGSNYAIGDLITLSNGVVLRVLTLSTTAVATASVVNGGSSQTASPPANPIAQVSTTGTGSGATFNLTWSSGAWCTYPRAYESTSTLQPMMADMAHTPEVLAATAAPAKNGNSEEYADEEAEDEEADARDSARQRTVTRARTVTPPHRGGTHR